VVEIVVVVVDMVGAIEPPGGGTTNSFDLFNEKKLNIQKIINKYDVCK
jgi:hypothetical protein